MKVSRRHKRFIRRLETEFFADDQNHRGISSDFSLGGMFIRTNHAYVPGTVLAMKVHLPDGTVSTLTGKVKRAVKTPIMAIKNGMGIEIIERDAQYTAFIHSLGGEFESEGSGEQSERPHPQQERQVQKPSAEADFFVVTCQKCGVRNKVVKQKLSVRCGRCGSPLAGLA